MFNKFLTNAKLQFATVFGVCVVLIVVVALAASQFAKLQAGTVLSLSHTQCPGSISDISALKFKELLEKNSDGTMTVTIYPNTGIAGGDPISATNMLSDGELAIHICSPGNLGNIDQRFTAFWLPFLFENRQQAEYFVSNPKVIETLNSWLAANDIRLLDLSYFGPRQISNNVREITKPEDLQGIKFRVSGNNPVLGEIFKTYGVELVNKDYSEVAHSLKTGDIQGLESPVQNFLSSKFFEDQKYLTLWDGIMDTQAWLIGNKAFAKLTPEQQAIVEKTIKEVNAWRDQINSKFDNLYVQTLKNKGVKVTKLTTAERSAFLQASKPAYTQAVKQLGQDTLLFFVNNSGANQVTADGQIIEAQVKDMIGADEAIAATETPAVETETAAAETETPAPAPSEEMVASAPEATVESTPEVAPVETAEATPAATPAETAPEATPAAETVTTEANPAEATEVAAAETVEAVEAETAAVEVAETAAQDVAAQTAEVTPAAEAAPAEATEIAAAADAVKAVETETAAVEVAQTAAQNVAAQTAEDTPAVAPTADNAEAAAIATETQAIEETQEAKLAAADEAAAADDTVTANVAPAVTEPEPAQATADADTLADSIINAKTSNLLANTPAEEIAEANAKDAAVPAEAETAVAAETPLVAETANTPKLAPAAETTPATVNANATSIASQVADQAPAQGLTAEAVAPKAEPEVVRLEEVATVENADPVVAEVDEISQLAEAEVASAQAPVETVVQAPVAQGPVAPVPAPHSTVVADTASVSGFKPIYEDRPSVQGFKPLYEDHPSVAGFAPIVEDRAAASGFAPIIYGQPQQVQAPVPQQVQIQPLPQQRPVVRPLPRQPRHQYANQYQVVPVQVMQDPVTGEYRYVQPVQGQVQYIEVAPGQYQPVQLVPVQAPNYQCVMPQPYVQPVPAPVAP